MILDLLGEFNATSGELAHRLRDVAAPEGGTKEQRRSSAMLLYRRANGSPKTFVPAGSPKAKASRRWRAISSSCVDMSTSLGRRNVVRSGSTEEPCQKCRAENEPSGDQERWVGQTKPSRQR